MRRHQEYVGAGFDLVRQPFVEADANGDTLGIAERGGAKKLFIARLAAAKQDELEIPFHQLGKDVSTRSRPFWAVSREIIATMGVSGLSGRPTL